MGHEEHRAAEGHAASPRAIRSSRRRGGWWARRGAGGRARARAPARARRASSCRRRVDVDPRELEARAGSMRCRRQRGDRARLQSCIRPSAVVRAAVSTGLRAPRLDTASRPSARLERGLLRDASPPWRPARARPCRRRARRRPRPAQQARLAGAVAADQADALARLDHQVGVVEEGNVSVGERNARELQQWHGGRPGLAGAHSLTSRWPSAARARSAGRSRRSPAPGAAAG